MCSVLARFCATTDISGSRITKLTDAEVKFGLIPREHWFQPDWIDEDKAKASREKMVAHNVIYGGESQKYPQ